MSAKVRDKAATPKDVTKTLKTQKAPLPNPNKTSIQVDLAGMSDDALVFLRAGLDSQMRKRRIAFSVGGVGERLAIEHFLHNPRLPKLQLAPPGTKNVDALSRNGDRYSIKAYCNAKKTGTIYPDPDDRDKQLFEYLLIVRMASDWSLQSFVSVKISPNDEVFNARNCCRNHIVHVREKLIGRNFTLADIFRVLGFLVPDSYKVAFEVHAIDANIRTADLEPSKGESTRRILIPTFFCYRK
jgi:hypothetical protein